jgi:hypothetical protein
VVRLLIYRKSQEIEEIIMAIESQYIGFNKG